MNITKRHKTKGGKTFRKKPKKISRKTKRKQLRLTKKDKREGGILAPSLRKAIVPIGKTAVNVTGDVVEEIAKNAIKDELLQKPNRLSNRATTPTRQFAENQFSSYSQTSGVPAYPMPKSTYYYNENQENMDPNVMRSIQQQLADVHKIE
jgi:hypothetical protein